MTSLARAGLLVTAAYLASRIVGWVRVAVISATFGASRDLDAFFAAFRIPDLLFQLVAAGALGSALIPVLAGLLSGDEPSRAWRVASTITNLMLVGLALLAALAFVAAPVLVPLMAPGFGAAATERTVGLTRIMLLSPVFLALGSVATSVLNSDDRFAAAAAAPIVYNLSIIAGAIALTPSMGVDGLAIGVVAGSMLHLLVQVPALRRAGARYLPVIDIRDPSAREALLLVAPRALGLGVSQLTLLVMTSLASGMAIGSITAFNVAFTTLQIPIGVIGVPLGIVVFPSLSRQLAGDRTDDFLELLARSLKLLVVVMVPLTVLGMVLRREVVTLLFSYGHFGQAAVDLTADPLLFMLLGLTAEALTVVLARAFYAGRDTRTPVAAAVLAVVVNVALAVALASRLGLSGLALGLAVGAWAEAGALLLAIRARHPQLDLAGVGQAITRSVAAAAGAGLLAFACLQGLAQVFGAAPAMPAVLTEVVVAGGVGGLAYLGLALAIRVPGVATLVRLPLTVLRR